MPLVNDRHVTECPTFGWPERWKQMFEFDGGADWLPVEEFDDGGTLVVRAELPDVDPDKDVQVTTDDGMVHIRAHRQQKSERRQNRGCRSEFRYGDFEREITLPPGATAKDVKGHLQRRHPGVPHPLSRKGGGIHQDSRR